MNLFQSIGQSGHVLGDEGDNTILRKASRLTEARLTLQWNLNGIWTCIKMEKDWKKNYTRCSHGKSRENGKKWLVIIANPMLMLTLGNVQYESMRYKKIRKAPRHASFSAQTSSEGATRNKPYLGNPLPLPESKYPSPCLKFNQMHVIGRNPLPNRLPQGLNCSKADKKTGNTKSKFRDEIITLIQTMNVTVMAKT